MKRDALRARAPQRGEAVADLLEAGAKAVAEQLDVVAELAARGAVIRQI